MRGKRRSSAGSCARRLAHASQQAWHTRCSRQRSGTVGSHSATSSSTSAGSSMSGSRWLSAVSGSGWPDRGCFGEDMV
eukprot:scaffold66327_cov58-Phaeocystis_antarctica.AAC.6